MANIKELMSADDDDLSKINTEGVTEEQFIDRLNKVAIVWAEIEPKHKQCEKELEFIKKWMIDNGNKIASLDFLNIIDQLASRMPTDK